MSKRRAYTAIGLFVFFAGLGRGQCPLPPDLAIAPLAPSIPAEMAKFAGAWGGGAWGGRQPTFLVVESLKADGTAAIVYSWGKDPPFDSGWIRTIATVANGHLRWVEHRGAIYDYCLEEDGSLLGRFTFAGRPASARLQRVASLDPAAVRSEAAMPVPVEWTELEIPEAAQVKSGGAMRLQATLYRNPIEGRHPLVIFNHGSTGPGVIPPSRIDRAWDQALVFRSLGYSVVIPMRRGRGRSGGELVEESDVAPSVQLAAAMEDLDAVMAFMRNQPYVDPARIVLSGQSRGGFLAVAYAGRHPRAIAGVVEFSGGWFGERTSEEAFNRDQLRAAGQAGGPPMLWLCAQHDSFYSPDYVSREFAGFKAAGGHGQLLTFDDVPGNGHFLSSWPEKWQGAVAAFLKTLPPVNNEP